MAYATNPYARLILVHPLPVAFAIMLFGMLGGIGAESVFGNALFERCGALTAGLGVLVFGIVASELLTRSQITFITASDGEPPAPFTSRTVRFALNCQAFVVFTGTMQWGFSGLLMEN